MHLSDGDIIECRADPSLGWWLLLEPAESATSNQTGWRLAPFDHGPAGPTDAALGRAGESWTGTARCGYVVDATGEALAGLQATRLAALPQIDLDRALLLRMKLEQGVEIRNPVAEVEAHELQRDAWVVNVVLPRVEALERAMLGGTADRPCVVKLVLADATSRRRLGTPLSVLVDAAYPPGSGGWVRATVDNVPNTMAAITVSGPIEDEVPFRVPLVRDEATWVLFERHLSQMGSTPSPQLVEAFRHQVAAATNRLYLTVPLDPQVAPEAWFWGSVLPAALDAIGRSPVASDTTAHLKAAFRLVSDAPEAWRLTAARAVRDAAMRLAMPPPTAHGLEPHLAVLGGGGRQVTFVASPASDTLGIVCARPDLREFLLYATDVLDGPIFS